MGIVDEGKSLSKCVDKVASFKASLPSRVDPAQISQKAKIPFKALTYREALLHRITELADTACELFKLPEKVISAFIITRAVHETFSLLYVLHTKISNVVFSKDLGDFDEYIMTNTFGYRTKGEDELPTMPNILGAIDKVDKIMEGSFRRTYENLSEYCHPNCSGVHAAYVKIDKENIWADIGVNHTRLPVEPYVGTLLASLEMFEHFYNNISEIMDEFTDICEGNLNKT